MEVEQSGHEPVLVWDTGIAGNFAGFATMPASFILSLKCLLFSDLLMKSFLWQSQRPGCAVPGAGVQLQRGPQQCRSACSIRHPTLLQGLYQGVAPWSCGDSAHGK